MSRRRSGFAVRVREIDVDDAAIDAVEIGESRPYV